jgi:GDP-4-dehydro-6-deoxy-D-mannose reductase
MTPIQIRRYYNINRLGPQWRSVAWSLAFAVSSKVGYNTARVAGAGRSPTLEGALKALITGISGFVGSHLAEYLLETTDWEVAGTVFGPYHNIVDLCGQLELYPAELSRLDVMTFIMERSRPDVIFHLAAQPLVSASRRDPWGTLETNVRMQLNVLEGVARIKPECRVLVVGSSEEYGLVSAGDLPIDEDTPLRPLSPYALSKVAQDLMGLQYHLTHKLHVVRVRPFNHIGPRQRVGFVAPDFASQIAAVELGLQPPTMEVGNLTARRDFSDVRDVVRAYVMLITHGEPGQVYNIGSGESHAIQEVLDTLLVMSQVSIDVRQDPDRMRPSDVPEVVCDATRIRARTGWQPAIPFEQSLQDILAYWREQTKARL